MGYISASTLVYSAIALLATRRLYWEITVGQPQRNFAKQHGCQPIKRMPMKDRILGLDFLWANLGAIKEYDALPFFRNCFEITETSTATLDVLGNTGYMTSDPENIKAMFSTGFDTWSIGRWRIDHMSTYIGYGIFTTEGERWKHSRGMLRPFFERSHIANLSMMDKHVSKFIDLLPKDGSTVDLQPLLHRLTFDVASEFLFGRSLNSLDTSRLNQDCEDFVDAFEYCSNPNLNGNNWKIMVILNPFLPDPKFKKCAQKIGEFADQIIDEELSSRNTSVPKDEEKDRWVFLDELVSQTSDRRVMRAEILSVLLAGRDTTATLVSNILFEIPRHPHVMEKLQQEIEEHVGSKVPTYEQLKDLIYLKAIVKESLRLYPIVALNSREALQDTVLPRGGGPNEDDPAFVPKGAAVMVHIHDMHRRKDIYGEDANEFRPERWLDHEQSLRPGWAYLPFGGGPRTCIGQNLAQTEAMFILVRLLQRFEFESRDSEPFTEKLTLICSSLRGCQVGVKERQF